MFAFICVFILFISGFFCSIFGEFVGWFGSIILLFGSCTFCVLFFVILFCSFCLFDVFGVCDHYSLFVFDFTSCFPMVFNYTGVISFCFSNVGVVLLFSLVMIFYMVLCFSFWYMFVDSGSVWFVSLLTLFAFSMSFLICISNVLFVYAAFEWVSWCSFFLIGWYSTSDSFKSAGKALILSSISDFFFLFFMSELYSCFGSLHCCLSQFVTSFTFIYYTCLCLVLLSKSAIFPLHSWLIWAMAGPTPVSCLLHSATLVTSGYVVVSNFVSDCSVFIFGSWFFVLLLINVIFGSIFSVFSYDVKKLVAYSTMSQISLLLVFFFTMPSFSFSYFIAHGFVKSSLFMCVGYVYHFFVGQDLSSSFGSFCFVEYYYFGFLFCCISLSAYPLSTFFLVKECLFDNIFLMFDSFQFVVFVLLNFCVFLTTVYCFLLIVCFFDLPSVFVSPSSPSLRFVSCYFLVFLHLFLFCSVGASVSFLFSLSVSLLFGCVLSLSIFGSSSSFSLFSLSYYSFFSGGCFWDYFLNMFGYIFTHFSSAIFVCVECFSFQSFWWFLLRSVSFTYSSFFFSQFFTFFILLLGVFFFSFV